MSQGLLEMFKASVSDAALVQVDNSQVVAEGVLGRNQCWNGRSSLVTDADVSFEGEADKSSRSLLTIVDDSIS